MKIIIPSDFKISSEQEAALKTEAARIENEIGTKRHEFHTADCSGYSVDGVMHVTSAVFKGTEKAAEPKAEKVAAPEEKKSAPAPKVTAPKAPAKKGK